MSISRPLAIITGGSSGIGLELAKQFAANGFDLAISGASERVFSSADDLRSPETDVYPCQADAATYDGVEQFWRFIKDLDRPIDTAVLNVGIGIGGEFAKTSLEDELRMVAINVSGTVHMAKRVVQDMVPRRSGRIMIVSSLSATTPTPYEAVYGPTKAFDFMFAEALREEMKAYNIVVTALLPGATDSDFHKNAGMGNSTIGRGHKNDKVEVARQGFEALMNDVDHVVGGDRATKEQALQNRTTPYELMARRHAEIARIED